VRNAIEKYEVCSCQQAGEDNFAGSVCARVFADTVGLGEDERGEERRGDGRCQVVGGGLRW